VRFDEGKIDAIFSHIDQCRLPGAAVGISIDGEPVYRKGFGLANLEQPLILSPSIRMRLGSTSKHFTCLAYLLMCEAGKARIDDPLGKYLPEVHPIAQRVTMRQLMGNTNGLRDACDIKFHFSGVGGRRVSAQELVAFYRDMDEVQFQPGAGWMYNNGGFVLLSAAIERISGQPLEEVLRTCIFEPIGMYDTLMRRWDHDFVPNSATLHMSALDGGFHKAEWGLDWTGAGSNVSTVNDMLRWLAHMDEPIVGSAETWAAMKAPQKLVDGTSTGYGFGLILDRYRGVETLSHPGGALGGNAQMIKVPSAKLDIVVMSNRHDVSGTMLAFEIIDACLGTKTATVTRSNERAVSGIFRSRRTGDVIQLLAREGQQFVSLGGIEMPFDPDEAGVLWPAGIYSYNKRSLALVGDSQQPGAIRMSGLGLVDEFVAVDTHKPAGPIAAARYRSEKMQTEALVMNTDRGPSLRMLGPFGTVDYSVDVVADGIWQIKQHNVMSFGGTVAFDVAGSGFRFSSYYTWSVPFRRCA
jgi:CubicO group peptidase (beta-lactamase class C family)